MFMALGVGAYVAAVFHLMAHGFTKGLLFLGSGSVIHAVDGEQDMDRMGALRRKVPITHWTFLMGALSLAGIPPLAGFFSKDAILGESFLFGYSWVFVIGLVVAGLTGFYMFRLMGKTFYGESHVDPAVAPRVHESPPSMTGPLVLLAVPTVLLGLLIGPILTSLTDSRIFEWLEPVFHEAEVILGIHPHEYELLGIDGALILASVGVAALGIGVGAWLFGFFGRRARLETVAGLTQRNRLTRTLYRASLDKWYFDDLNHLLFYRFGGAVARAVMWFDVRVIDGVVNGTGSATQAVGDRVRHIQTGRVQNYALGIAVGLVVMVALFVLLAR
jgi:NADH-quinone oxidoreductase subunit L